MNSKRLLIWWNNNFPYDRIWRKKYGVAFNSPTHREINQIDVYLDALEDKIIINHIETHKHKNEALEHYKKTGEFIIQTEADELKAFDLFTNLDLKQLDSKQEEQDG